MNPKNEKHVREAQAVEQYVVETPEEKALRVRPPGAVDEFIEEWTEREDVRAILQAWAK